MKEYRNAIRTRKFIREAFAELLEERKDVSKITVKGLVDRANISKSTFYGHYSDIYAVAEEIEDELIQLLNESIDEYIKDNTASYAPYIDKIVQHLKKEEALYRKLISGNVSTTIITKLKKILTNKISDDVKISFLSNNIKLRRSEIEFISAGSIDLFVQYFQSAPGTYLSLDEIASLVNKILIKLSK